MPSVLAPEISAELFSIPVSPGHWIVFAPLRHAAFVANARTVNLIADLREGRWDTGADPDGGLLALLRRLGMVDGGPEIAPVTTFAGVPQPIGITLFLTTTCNLRCTYCYASAGDTPARSMGLDVAKRGIDFVSSNAALRKAKTFDLSFHGGGEPTGNWQTMTEAVAYARARATRLGLAPPCTSAATNGVLRDDQIDWIIDNLNGGVSVSFDGLPEVHDRHRVTAEGVGSSRKVMHTLRRFDAAHYPYGVKMTVTADLISRLAESVEFISETFGAQRIQIEPSYQLGRWRHAANAETEEFIAAFRLARERAARHGREVSFSAARLGLLTNHFCAISQDSFSLSPDGNVSACYEVFTEDGPHSAEFFYGWPESKGSGYRFNLAVLDRLRGQAVQHRSFCQGCFAKWSCAGDCYHKALSITESRQFQGTDRCHITRELTKDQILARIAASGGLFWHEAERRAEGVVSAARKAC